MTADEIVGGILQREGGWRDAKTRPDGTVDPPTNRGITLPTLQAYYKQYVDASVVVTDANLRELSTDLATRIYTSMFVDAPGFTPANIPFEPLRVQLIDFGVNSGPARAVRWLQRVLRLVPTGRLDQPTVVTLGRYIPMMDGHGGAILHDALVAARSYMIDQLEDHGQLRSADEERSEERRV